ncbi:MAG: ABC transporter ATP-binding protein [Acidimicrobiia bacterium]
MPILVARDLVKAFDGKDAVAGVSLSLAEGERVALLGPNGAGKTTSLLMLVGAIIPDSGSVDVGGYRLPKQRSEAMEQVGFAAGFLPLPDHLKVREVLDVFAGIYRVDDAAAVIERGLKRFRITHLANQMASKLSSGQRTLVGIVKATLHRPRLLVLDEPTASLDPDVAHRVREGLEEICDEDGTALLVTSHNMTDVERICERVIFLSRGKVIADGKPDEVASVFGQPDLESMFLHVASEEEI